MQHRFQHNKQWPSDWHHKTRAVLYKQRRRGTVGTPDNGDPLINLELHSLDYVNSSRRPVVL